MPGQRTLSPLPRMPNDWLVPDWPAPAAVRALCTTRAGGLSSPPCDSLNLGDHVGDAPEHVAANRQVVQETLQARPVFLRQVHGWRVASLAPETPDGTEADACVSAEPGVACAIMVADCLPVLLADTAGAVVGAAHAGWRGLAGEGGGGVIEAACAQLRAQQASPAEVIAWLGPCIGREAFEVGDEVRAAFIRHDADAGAMFRPHRPGKWLADLQGLARQRLRALGITGVYGNDGTQAWCTVANPSPFFSHRRDSAALGHSGRFAAFVWLA